MGIDIRGVSFLEGEITGIFLGVDSGELNWEWNCRLVLESNVDSANADSNRS